MSNVTIAEYEAALSKAAALHGADGGANLDRGDAIWSAPNGSVTVSISLRGSIRGGVAPRLLIGSSRTLPTDALLAVVVLEEMRATVQKAAGAFMSIHDLAVWYADCPCDSCSGTGMTRGGSCSRCEGSGVRNDKGGGQ